MNKCSCKNCDLEVFGNSDKCILHCEKNDWRPKIPNKEFENLFSNIPVNSSILNVNLNLFWDIFNQQITSNKVQSFNNIIFPTNVDFELKELENKILIFKNCKFIDIFDFKFLNNVERVEFNKCHFYKLIKFEKIVFKEDFLFQNCVIYKNAELLFIDINFNGIVSFIKTKSEFKFKFTQVRFNDIALFNNSEIGNLSFENTFFRKEANFLNMNLNSIENRETARIIKDSFEQQNNIIEANKFYALEMKEREKELDKDVKKGKNIFEWLVFKIHGLASNHSQDWTLSLLWIILISCIVTVFNQTYFYEVDRLLFISLIAIIPIGFAVFTKELIQKIGLLIFTFIFIQLNAINWDSLANQLNPFSIMTGKEHLTFSGLIYKVIIAYLIYQLIISIRQNTRRK